MDLAKQNWEILQGLGTDLANRVREFMVFGNDEDVDGVLVVTEDGLAFWFGYKLFDWNESTLSTKPTLLDVPDLVCMAHGHDYILLLNKRGEIYSMGWNNQGQLGLGTVDEKFDYTPLITPQLISSPHKFISVRCGYWHSVALTDDGKVWAWGGNDNGQVGVPSSTEFLPSPRQIPELDSHRVVEVECGGWHSLALTDRGEVYAWGSNNYGQLGDGSTSYQPTPIRTPSLVQSMAGGESHTLLLTQTGEVYACGGNGCGQLGLSTDTESSDSFVKVAGLPLISQISSHFATDLSIAMSSDKRCFVWGELVKEKFEKNYIKVSTPLKLPPVYSTVESPLSFFSSHRNTPHSVRVPETPPSRLSTKMSRMFDNPETSPDVQFVVEKRTIHAHRNILSNSSDYFARMFSEKWMALVDSKDPIVRVTITDHSYQAFLAFLRFLYTDSLEVPYDFLLEMFELANLYLVPELQQLCLSRMRTTLTPTTCCLYYPLTHRHSLLPELATFQQELVQFASTRMWEVVDSAAYHSMEPDLRDILTNAVQNILQDQDTSSTSDMDT